MAGVGYVLIGKAAETAGERGRLLGRIYARIKCGLRRLRSGRVAHRLSDYNRHIAYDQYLSMYFYHQ